MIYKSFIGLTTPRLEYQSPAVKLPELKNVSRPKKVTLFLPAPSNQPDRPNQSDLPKLSVKIGEKVKTGQKISLAGDSDGYVVSTVTGTVSSLSSFTGTFGRFYFAVSIETDDPEAFDEEFGKTGKDPSLDMAKTFLLGTPGNPLLTVFSDPAKPIHTLVVCGADSDLLITTNQYVVKTRFDALKSGIALLKKITGVENILLIVPKDFMHGYGHIGAQVKAIDSIYPSAHPHSIMKDMLGQVVPAGKTWQDLGVCFFSAEAVASIGTAFETGRIPVSKVLTLIKKDGSRVMVSARIGTPIGDLLKALNVVLSEKDRIILGGPMTGSAIYSQDHPIQPDTDAVMVQDSSQVPEISDYPCINCGECIRVCPAKIPINMLVRFLEAGHYEEAADQYDLYSCMECGLCSFVCVSKIPIFQYIKLGKYELGKVHTGEAMHD